MQRGAKKDYHQPLIDKFHDLSELASLSKQLTNIHNQGV